MILQDFVNGVQIVIDGRFRLHAIAEAFREPYDAGEDLPWWSDNLGHFLCGVVIGAGAHALFGGMAYPAVVFIALAGVWEVFEYQYNVRPWDPEDDWSFDRAIEDTLLDTYVGLTGALIAAYGMVILF